MRTKLTGRYVVSEIHRFPAGQDRVAGGAFGDLHDPVWRKRSLRADRAPVLPVARKHPDALGEQILQRGRQIVTVPGQTQQHAERQGVPCEALNPRFLDPRQKRGRVDAERARRRGNIIPGERLKIRRGERLSPTEPADRVREPFRPYRGSAGDANRRAGFLEVPFNPALYRKPASARRYHRLVQRIEIKAGRRVSSLGEFLQVPCKFLRRVGVLRQPAPAHGTSGAAFVLRQSSSFRRLAGARCAQQDEATEALQLDRWVRSFIGAGTYPPNAFDVPESHVCRSKSAVTGSPQQPAAKLRGAPELTRSNCRNGAAGSPPPRPGGVRRRGAGGRGKRTRQLVVVLLPQQSEQRLQQSRQPRSIAIRLQRDQRRGAVPLAPRTGAPSRREDVVEVEFQASE